MNSAISLLMSSRTWAILGILLDTFSRIFPHATDLATTAQHVSDQAAAGNSTGAAMAAGSGLLALGLHIYEHGKAQPASNAKPQTAAAPNEG